MEIKRTLETKNATYDLNGLTKEQFSRLVISYEQQMYRWSDCYPDEDSDELLKKLRKMAENDILVI